MKGRGDEFMKALPDVALIPEKTLDVLDPLEVRDDHAARIGQDVGNNEDVPIV